MKALVVILVVVMGMAAISIGNAEAGIFTCTISQAGADNGGFYKVVLSDAVGTAFTDMLFLLSPANAQQKNMYAAALTAFANSTNVVVSIPATRFKVHLLFR